ncbi:hypothetical protein Turpa_1139 [Turneriella parva DSM 21527]|uniref:YtxH domain-containing protein n=1 Tax=Turneriella parva (strain ATCC BAA-1111 / DSM 21527 / NCTC 11395 / H) TaxID=869212 RepID=I4B3D0_TURPD|nr:hypothetical protein Turpa_1139 [Turneriella parva DSM 21527]
MTDPIRLISYIASGAVVGYLYYRLIGCSTGGGTRGACAITSRPVPSIIYGAVMGAMLGWR